MGGVVPGQLKTAEKSNEITAIPELINLLDIKGKIITTDAMECQKDIAEKIVSQDVLNDSIEQEFCGLTVTGCASSPNAWSGPLRLAGHP
nr:Transposase [Salmonella sp. NCTC 7297]